MSDKRTLRARDIERLENTSFATLMGDAHPDPPDLPYEIDGSCTCACQTCLCCLPEFEDTALCCDLTVVYSLDGRCVVGVSRILNIGAA